MSCAACAAIELGERDLLEVRQALEAEPAADLRARAVREHEQHAETRQRRGRAPRGDRATADRASDSPRARARAASRPALARRHSTSSPSSEVLRSFASNAAVSSLSGIGRSRRPASSGARATSAGSIAASSASSARTCSSCGQRCRRDRRASTRSRARRSSSCSLPYDWHSPIATTAPRCLAVRANSATRRDFPMPASAEMPTMRPLPASASSSFAAIAIELRPPADDRQLVTSARLRDACRFAPVSANTDTGSALPFTVIGASCSQRKRSPAASTHRFGDVDLPGGRVRHETRREIDGIAEAGERLPLLVAVRAAAQAART